MGGMKKQRKNVGFASGSNKIMPKIGGDDAWKN